MNSRADVIIIGGGVIGSAIAYFLAKEGVKPLVIEKRKAGQATCAAGGMLGAQVEMSEPGPLFDLAVKSRSLFSQIQEELYEISKVDIELNRTGMLRIAVSEEDRNELLGRIPWQTKAGYRAIWLEDKDLRQECGDFISSTYGALFLPDDYQVRSPRYLRALIEAAVVLGATFVEETEVIGFVCEGERICGVKTLNGEYYADQVVIATGAWSGLLASYLGIEIPVYPQKGQSIFVDTTPHVSEYTIYTHGTYIIPKANGQTYIGATAEKAGFDSRPTLQNIERLTTSATRLMPALSRSFFAGTITGFRPASHDGLPYIGRLPQYEGLYAATGHWRNGILLSAITGQSMAELLLNRATSISLAPFSPERLFHTKDTPVVSDSVSNSIR
ncbi:glycine oxidase ThiO [Collibacillus ludicampi]|uniref:glycine oxidase n=1 Tax=Collibacillus ludicampi TaxID=2771369 RepID=A0AAV4LAQ1_9BACL|nr:glycine oxidase ThiO [Collibacillus ludicampi]GIM44799.1 glycine oxidase ThiO [Collibacillus ludicampi]